MFFFFEKLDVSKSEIAMYNIYTIYIIHTGFVKSIFVMYHDRIILSLVYKDK